MEEWSYRRKLFEAKVDRSGGPDACHPWVGCVTSTRGYGLFNDGQGKNRLAHRWLWQDIHGYEPPGTIEHSCHTRALAECPGGRECVHRRCQNASHWEVVTNKENVLRGGSPSAVNARKTRCKHGHAFTPENTYTYHRKGQPRRGCRLCNRDKMRLRRSAVT